jgi:uncharacterized protein YndB with AHSA1/START domain
MEAMFTDGDGKELGPDETVVPGDRFVVKWHIGTPEEGEYLEANDLDRIRYTFGDRIWITATMEDVGDGSVLVTMQQDHDRTDDENLRIMFGFKEGWSFYLANLKSILEGGKDLRDFDHDVEHMINY